MKKMRAKHFGLSFTFFVSDDILEQYLRDWPGHISPTQIWQEIMQNCLLYSRVSELCGEDTLYRKYLRRYCSSLGRSRMNVAVLVAHGGTDTENQWRYQDGPTNNLVAEWVAEKDGHYAALIVSSCNEDALIVRSRRSLLAIPDRVIGSPAQVSEGAALSWWDPIQQEEIDNNTIEYHTR